MAAQKITYSLEIQNLDETVDKLKELNNLLNKTQGKNISSVGTSNASNTGGSSRSGTSSGALAGAVAGTAGSVIEAGIIQKGLSNLNNNAINFPERFYKKLEKKFELEVWPKIKDQFRGLPPDMVHNGKENEFLKFIDIQEKSFAQFGKYSSTKGLPPIISTSQGLKGMLEKFILPFKAHSGNILNGPGGLKTLLSPSGLGAGIGSFVGKLGPLGLIAAGVAGSLFIMKKAIDLLIEGIKVAAEAFRTAAREGLSVFSSQRINNAFKAVGMNTPDLSSIRPLLGGKNDADVILNAARVGQLGEAGQQLLNMANEFRQAMKASVGAAKDIEESSAAAQQLSLESQLIATEWKATVSEFAKSFYSLLMPLLEGVRLFLFLIRDLEKAIGDVGERLLSGLSGTFPVLAAILQPIVKSFSTPNKPDNKQYFFGNAGGNIAPTTSLEKMGLLVGLTKNKSETYLQQIATNTGKLLNMLPNSNGTNNGQASFGYRPNGYANLPYNTP